MRRTIASIAAVGFLANVAHAADTINIGFIDPLSGNAANIGEIALKHLQWMVEQLNAAGGANGKKFEVVTFDNKTNPQETVIQAQKAVDRGIRFLTQGNDPSRQPI
jgi:branched-chain amino acid transport system substrate-binding protein